MAARRKKRRQVRRNENLACPFCKSEKNPDYKDYKGLYGFISDRARIYGRERTGVCMKHQRRLSTAIKRARYLGLLPYAPRV